MEVTKTDMRKIIAYLSDAANMYTDLGAKQTQKHTIRAHMIRQLTAKLKKAD